MHNIYRVIQFLLIMKKTLSKFFACLALLTFCFVGGVYAQITISGTVIDASNNEPLIGANIAIKDKVIGTVSDTKGNFSLTTTTAPPFTIIVSVLGYKTQEVEITGSQSGINIQLEEQALLGQEVVVSASRIEEGVLQAPVAVEKMDILAIQQSGAPSFYDNLKNIKGVDVSTQSLTFSNPSTRGFNTNGNARVNQLIDGLDNIAPGLNFSVGNIVGISELDLESVELLPGASSALYGPGGMNGTILMTSKSPFDYQGLSATAKVGLMHLDSEVQDPQPYYNLSARYAKSFNNRFAFKVNVSYLTADDWQASNFDSFIDNANHNLGTEATTRLNDPGYDGINTYGDEIGTNIGVVADQLVGLGLITPAQRAFVPDEVVTRTGYTDEQLVDYDTESLKLNAALHYRITDNLELIGQINYGEGTTVYTSNNRNALSGFRLTQAKLELKSSNGFFRVWTTQERSGDSYDAGNLGIGLTLTGEGQDNDTWYGNYVAGYLQGLLTEGSPEAAHNFARTFADQGRLQPGTQAFETAFNQIRNTPISEGGALFIDESNLYHVEGMYNLNKIITFAEVLVGGSYRRYQLRSNGTLFDDANQGGGIPIDEIGVYTQISKSFAKDHLKLIFSARYDKNENFDGRFTPRGSLIWSVDNAKQHNVRFSAQTAFRYPTTQNQFINLPLPGRAILLGNLLTDREFATNPVYSLGNVGQFGGSFLAATENPDIQAQAAQAVIAGGGNPADPNFPLLVQQQVVGLALGATQNILQPFQFDEFKVERVFSLEAGYRGVTAGGKLFIDAFGYYNTYNDFVGQQFFVQAANPTDFLSLIGLSPDTRTLYGVPVNINQEVNTYGWGLGLDYQIGGGFIVKTNVAFNDIEGVPQEAIDNGFRTEFNTPNYRFNLGLSNREVVENLGFSVNWRFQESFIWESNFGTTLIPSIHTFDAQVSYKIPNIKSIVKVGAQNLFNRYYTTGVGNPQIGGLYYISVTFDEFLR